MRLWPWFHPFLARKFYFFVLRNSIRCREVSAIKHVRYREVPLYMYAIYHNWLYFFTILDRQTGRVTDLKTDIGLMAAAKIMFTQGSSTKTSLFYHCSQGNQIKIPFTLFYYYFINSTYLTGRIGVKHMWCTVESTLYNSFARRTHYEADTLCEANTDFSQML